MRNHPLLVATTAASVGVMLGAYVAVQLLVTSPIKNEDGVRPTVQAAAESKAVRDETTGQTASADPDGTTTDCSQQTWPYLSRDCMERNKSAPRVVSTDKLDQPTLNAIENPPTRERTEPPSQSSANASAAAIPPAAAEAAPPAGSAPPPAATVSAAAPAQGVAGPETAASDSVPPKAAKTKHAKKPKQKSKPDDRALAKADDNDDDNAPQSREWIEERRTVSSRDRSRRIGERSTERDYDVPSFDGRGQRRVTVIRRNDGGSVERIEGDGSFERRDSGGPFGGLFGFR